ncbi:hypothetical protein KFL_000690280 [Klebsormidium nitens]|uniref:Plastid lipid-associated protein/fibrillin conserved domain-containing protein n=1 Tax=Klebsormidium nitens TaxID=105231 RepID=A0A1Y1HQZ9_KLENI|nr:hypothetical protein KFL_000690280 [Klebsormidium nitens]|eukprot:GAQ81050.1 hypothetical protein KFL_000690280 [Klebsormidium nitens]
MALSISKSLVHSPLLAPVQFPSKQGSQERPVSDAAFTRPSRRNRKCNCCQAKPTEQDWFSLEPFLGSLSRLQAPLTSPRRFSPDASKHQSRQAAARASSSAKVSTSGSSGSAAPQSLQEQKAAILKVVANTNRGKNTTAWQRRQILDLIESVEPQNPTPDPIRSPLISGTWSLLYTASTKEEFTYAGTEEGPFLARVKPAAFGQVRSKGSTQIIQSDTGHVDNIAEFSVFGKPGSLTITGSFVPAAPLPDRGAVRIDVRFESFRLKLGWISLRVPLGWVNPTGWIDTTYLDSELRIGRGDKGSVFVTVRRK